MPKLLVRCPAKLNLFLAVGPRDARGYHPLRTTFQAISLFDTLLVESAEQTSFEWDSPDVPLDNTVTKALRLLQEIAQVPPLKVQLHKEIPSESGLGGGSSDAAGLIRVINRFLPAPIADHHLMDVAVAVGADVPFFLMGGRARGEGYGEKLTALEDPNTEWYVVVRPPIGCNTREAFRKLDANPYEWREFTEEFYNDFERVMPCDCEDWIERLQVHGADGALLTGSGSAVFGRFRSESDASAAAVSLRGEWSNSYVNQTGEIPVWVTRSLTRLESLSVETL